MSMRIKVDSTANAAYIKLSDAPIVRTVEFNEEILVDVDQYGVAVGVEVLDEGAALPFAALCDDFHVHSDVIELLRLIRPSVAAFLQLSSAADGATSTPVFRVQTARI